MRRLRLRSWWCALVVLFLLLPARLGAQGIECTNCGALSVYPVPATVTQNENSGSFTAKFVVSNTYTWSFNITPSCQASAGLTCGTVTPSSFTLGTGHDTVFVQYTTGSGGSRTLTLNAYHDDEMVPSPATGYQTVQVVGPPSVSLVVPVLTSGSRAVVANRQPVIRALLTPNGSPIDTAQTILKWRGTTVTTLARRNRGLLEWEVDSTRWLGLAGDSAEIYIKACAQSGHCREVTRWAVLPNDDTPVLAFTGMPAGTLGSGYRAPFGPGLSVHQAEVEGGFGVPGYVSMGAGRSAGLVYSTRQSYPRALVLVDLELRWPVGTPDQIKLLLKDGVLTKDSVVLASPTCATGATRRCRASLQADYAGSTFSTPTRKWLKVEARITSGVTTKSSTDSVEVVLVDRRTTYYGSGWWPAGVSQLVAAGDDRLLISATGTATIYRGNGDSVYLPPPGSFTNLARFVNRFELQPRGSTARVRFNTSGWLMATEDINGNKDSVVYSGTAGKVTKFRDAVGKELTFTYDGNDKLSTITDPASRQSKISINGGSYQLTFDSLNIPAARTTWVYQTYPGTGTVVLTKRIGVIADTTIVTYDSTFLRRPSEVKVPRVQDPGGSWVTPTISYTPYERRGFGALVPLDSTYVQMTDPRGFWTKSLLTRWGQAMRTWDQLGLLGKSTYDTDGYLLWSEGKNGDSSRTYQVYDTFKRAVKSYIIRAVGDTLRGDSLVYNSSHWVTAVIDNRGKVTSNTYDGIGRLTKVKTPNNDSTLYWYRSDGLVDSVRLPNEATAQRYAYDATWKNVFRVMDPTGDTVSTSTYDNLGRVDSVVRRIKGDTLTGRAWQKVRPYYNHANQVDSSVTLRAWTGGGGAPTWPSLTDTLNATWAKVRFDAAGRDSLRINNRGKATRYVYDRLGRLTARYPWTDSTNVRDSMLYDVAGNVVKTNTRRGDELTADFDSRNRDTLAVIPGIGTVRKAFTGPLDQITRVWVTSYVDSIGGVVPDRAWRYDQRGRLLTDSAWSGTTARAIAYQYDTYERRYRVTDALGEWETEFETNRGHPVKLKTPLGDTVSYVWDARSRPIGPVVHSGGIKVSTQQNYTATGGIFSFETTIGSTGWLGGKWIRLGQQNGNPAVGAKWTEKLGSAAPTDSTKYWMTYDGDERLTSWEQYYNAPNYDVAYTFDATGNLAGTHTYDATTDRLTSDGVSSYAYDRAGNLVSKSGGGVTWTYGYDGLNRLVSARRNGTVVGRYAYDVTGQRIAKRVPPGSPVGTPGYTRFVYRGAAVAFETDSAGTVGMQYVWGLGTDDLVGFKDGAGGTHYYAVKDKLGSIRNVVTRSGSWTMRLRHRPYGESIDSIGAGVALRYRWTGREWDAELGMYYFRARYYDPSMQRFVQEDPIGYAGGGNLYAYVHGSPLEARDPSGLRRKKIDPQPVEMPSTLWLADVGWGSGRGGDWDGDGLDDFREFADYAFGFQMWDKSSKTWREDWLRTQWTLDHEIDQETAEGIRYLLQLGRVHVETNFSRIADEVVGPIDFLNPEKAANQAAEWQKIFKAGGIHLRGHVYVNRMQTGADLFAFVLAHEFGHVVLHWTRDGRDRYLPSENSCQEEYRADRFAALATTYWQYVEHGC